MKRLRPLGPVFLLLLALGSLFVLTGCATSEPTNMSERPWNAPKGWETGLPPAFTEGR